MDKTREVFLAQLEEDPVWAYRLLQLRLMILERGLSRSAVAEATGCSDSYLSRVLHGKVKASVSFLDRVDDSVDRLTHGGRDG